MIHPENRAPRSARFAVAAALALSSGTAGCEDAATGPAPTPSTSTSAPIPEKLRTLHATRGTESLAIRSALAFGKVGSKVHLRLSSKQEDCGALRGRRASEAPVVEVALDPTLRPDGQIVWTAVSPKIAGGDATVPRATVEMQASDVESEVRAQLDVELEPSGGDKTPVRLKGLLQARPCGRVHDALPPSRPQRQLHLSVAGRTVEMRAAVLSVEGPDEFSITIASAPRGCGMTDAVGDVELKLTAQGDPARLSAAFLYGELIEAEIRVEPPGDAIEIDIADPVEGSARVALKGTYDHDGLTVKLDGYADAEMCLP